MELRQYFNIFIRRWWVILPTIFISLTGALLFSYSQTPIYEATSSFVTILSYDAATNRDTVIYGLDTLTNRQRIFVTYCEIMISGSVRQEAYTLLNLDPASPILQDYKVACANLPETNVILVTAQGPSPALIEQLTEAVGLVGMARANSLYTYFPLAPLDHVQLVEEPVSPKHQQNAVLGGAFGVILGITAALMIEYLRRPGERIATLSIRNAQIGIYNDIYFERRVQEEINRAHARNRPISMVLLRIMPDEDFFLMPKSAQNVLVRKIAFLLEENVGYGHLVAYLKPTLFGILLIETPAEEANTLIVHLQNLVRIQPIQAEGGFQTTFTSRAGIVASSGNLMSYPEMYEATQRALKASEADPESPIHVIHGVPRPFMDDDEIKYLEEDSPRRMSSKENPFITNQD